MFWPNKFEIYFLSHYLLLDNNKVNYLLMTADGEGGRVNQFPNRNWMQQIQTGYRQSATGDKAVRCTDSWLPLQHAKYFWVILVLTRGSLQPVYRQSGQSFNGDPVNQRSCRELSPNARNKLATLHRATVRASLTKLSSRRPASSDLLHSMWL